MNKYAGIVDRTKIEDAEDLAEKSVALPAPAKSNKKADGKTKSVPVPVKSAPVRTEKPSAKLLSTTRVTVSIPVDYDLALKELKAIRKLKGRKVTADELILEALQAFTGNPEFAQCLIVAQERIKLYS